MDVGIKNRSTEIYDYTNLTCTNLMLKLKIQTNRLKNNHFLEFYSTREQHDNIKTPFSRKNFHFSAKKIDHNIYHVKILKT